MLLKENQPQAKQHEVDEYLGAVLAGLMEPDGQDLSRTDGCRWMRIKKRRSEFRLASYARVDFNHRDTENIEKGVKTNGIILRSIDLSGIFPSYPHPSASICG